MKFDEIIRRSYQIPGQTWPSEIAWIHRAFLGSKSHAEVGVFCGRSLFPTCAGMKGGSTVYAIDPGSGMDSADSQFSPPTKEWMDDVLSATIRSIRSVNAGVNVNLMRCLSIQAAVELCQSGVTLDSVFIDAGHEYADVKCDIESWLPLVRKGGIISGHDYCSRFPGVMDAVNELLPNFHIVSGTRIWFSIVDSQHSIR